jgi:phi13 family phage major tail protein
MVKIGLDMAYYAEVIEDVKGSITYDNPIGLEAIQQIGVNPKVSRVQVPGDNIIQEDLTECLGADINAQRKEFTPAEEAKLLGRPTDENGGVYGGTSDNPPYIAFGYRRTFKGSTAALYVWILKTKFAPSNSTADSKPVDNLTPQYDSMSASAITRKADGQWIYSIKSSDPDFWQTFFTKTTLEKLVNLTTPTALALSSSVPVDGTTGVSKTAGTVLTFNNKIVREAVSVIDATTGDVVAVAKSWDAAGKVLTITPSSALSGSTMYIVSIAGVMDIYGQSLVASGRNFTTAA